MSVIDHDLVRKRLDHVRERIELAGGDVDNVRVLAVTKGFDLEAVRAAVQVGLIDVGENYAQEARAKYDLLESEPGDDPAPRWHFIGHLQRNKVRLLAPFVNVWQSVDSVSLVDEIAKRAPLATVFLEVNLAGASGRSGCAWEDLSALVDHARRMELDVRGVMGVAPMGDAESARPAFRRLAEVAHRFELSEISMGMSGDLEVAVQEGATMVRVGSALFGSRPPRPAL